MTTLESVIAQCAPALLGYFIRRVENTEDAADLVSETMVAAWKASKRMPHDGEEARMWLFGVARNTLSHHSRSTRRRDALVERLGQSLSAHHADGDSDALDVRRAVSGLPAELGELVRLVHWDGFTLEQAAAHLGLRPSTARGRHARAKVLLREKLETVRALA